MIETKGLCYAVERQQIISDISLQVQSSKITAILGQNGAGKSSLMNCLNGSYKSSSGSITIANKPIQNYKTKQLAQICATLFQSQAMSFPLTVLEVVLLGRYPFEKQYSEQYNDEVVQSALEQVDAWHLKDRAFTTLSGGEQQRVNLARIFAQIWGQKNSYLLLDEPFTALDLKHQHAVFSYLKTLAKQYQMTICVVLHDLRLAKQYADTAILLHSGKVCRVGSVNQVLTKKYIESVFEIAIDKVL